MKRFMILRPPAVTTREREAKIDIALADVHGPGLMAAFKAVNAMWGTLERKCGRPSLVGPTFLSATRPNPERGSNVRLPRKIKGDDHEIRGSKKAALLLAALASRGGIYIIAGNALDMGRAETGS